MKMPHELRSEAQRYRRLVVGITDRRATEALKELATEYDELAGHLEREQAHSRACLRNVGGARSAARPSY